MNDLDQRPAGTPERKAAGDPAGTPERKAAGDPAAGDPAAGAGRAPDVNAAPEPSPAPEAGDPFAVIHTRPGETVPWPPRPDQRGLSAPYPPGGIDPDPEAGRLEERRYLRLLVAMVVVIVGSGLALTILGVLLGLAGTDAAP